MPVVDWPCRKLLPILEKCARLFFSEASRLALEPLTPATERETRALSPAGKIVESQIRQLVSIRN